MKRARPESIGPTFRTRPARWHGPAPADRETAHSRCTITDTALLNAARGTGKTTKETRRTQPRTPSASCSAPAHLSSSRSSCPWPRCSAGSRLRHRLQPCAAAPAHTVTQRGARPLSSVVSAGECAQEVQGILHSLTAHSHQHRHRHRAPLQRAQKQEAPVAPRSSAIFETRAPRPRSSAHTARRST